MCGIRKIIKMTVDCNTFSLACPWAPFVLLFGSKGCGHQSEFYVLSSHMHSVSQDTYILWPPPCWESRPNLQLLRFESSTHCLEAFFVIPSNATSDRKVTGAVRIFISKTPEKEENPVNLMVVLRRCIQSTDFMSSPSVLVSFLTTILISWP